MKLSDFISVLQANLKNLGDKPIAFYDNKTGDFGSFVSLIIKHNKGEFWGFMHERELADYLKSLESGKGPKPDYLKSPKGNA